MKAKGMKKPEEVEMNIFIGKGGNGVQQELKVS